MKHILVLIAGMLLCQACNQKKVAPVFENEALKNSYLEYNADKNTDAAAGFAALAMQYAIHHPNAKDRKHALESALQVTREHNLHHGVISFLTLLIRDHHQDKSTPDRIFELGKLMKENNKNEAGNALLLSYTDRFKNGSHKEEAIELLGDKSGMKIQDYLLETGNRIFENPDPTGINRLAAQAYVDACEAFAIANPDHVSTPDYLYRASDVSKTLRTHSKTLTLYDWIIDRYPNFEKTPEVLFLKGFILQNDLANTEAAREAYAAFLNKFPRHSMAQSAQFLLDNIDKSDDEILDVLEKKRQQSVQ